MSDNRSLHDLKEYGPHKYDEDGTSDCAHDCGCWAGPSRSGGPLGLDPFGTCPGNPVDGVKLGKKADYEYVVNQRIDKLSARAYRAEEALKSVEPGTLELAKQLAEARGIASDRRFFLRQIYEQLSTSETQKFLKGDF